jgi:hypothetical protein
MSGGIGGLDRATTRRTCHRKIGHFVPAIYTIYECHVCMSGGSDDRPEGSLSQPRRLPPSSERMRRRSELRLGRLVPLDVALGLTMAEPLAAEWPESDAVCEAESAHRAR